MAWWVAQAALAGYSLHQKIKGSKIQEDAAVRAAEARKKQIDLINEQASENIRRQKIQGQKIFGRQIVGYAAAGVDVSAGSPISILEDEGRKVHEEISRIRREAELQIEAIEAGIQAQIGQAQAMGKAQRDAAWGSFGLQGASIGADWYKHHKTIEAMDRQTGAIRGDTAAGVAKGRAAGAAIDVAMSGIALQKARLEAGGFGASQVRGQFPKPTLMEPSVAPNTLENDLPGLQEFGDLPNLDFDIVDPSSMSPAQLRELDDFGSSARISPDQAKMRDDSESLSIGEPIPEGGFSQGFTAIQVDGGLLQKSNTPNPDLSGPDQNVYQDFFLPDGDAQQARIQIRAEFTNATAGEAKVMRFTDKSGKQIPIQEFVKKIDDKDMDEFLSNYVGIKEPTEEDRRKSKNNMLSGSGKRSRLWYLYQYKTWELKKDTFRRFGQ